MKIPEWVQVPDHFGIEGYARVLTAISEATEKGPRKLVLDFSEVAYAYPNGMVPLIATLSRLKMEHGIETEVILPASEQLVAVFEGVGWARYLASLAPEFEELPERTPQFTPIRPFGREHLTRVHASIMEVLVTQKSLAEYVADAAHWALWEVMDNVLNHAGTGCGWVQASTFRDKHHLNIVVADSGLGIRRTLSERHPDLSERDALRRAIESGETRNPTRFKGYGLHGCWDIALQNRGELQILSGGWRFVQRTATTGKKESVRHYYPLRTGHVGTVIELMVRTNRPVDLGKALGQTRPFTMLELTQTTGNELVFDIQREAEDVGTRDAGRKLRTKVANLSQVESEDRIVLDFSKVSMVSSSFADEFVAKLASRLGKQAFQGRFELRGMNSSVNTVVQIALWNRTK